MSRERPRQVAERKPGRLRRPSVARPVAAGLVAGLLALLAIALPACARKITATAERDMVRRLPPDALLYAELDVRGVFATLPEQRTLLLALVPNACLALVDETWTATLAFWDGPPDELAIGLTGPSLAAVQDCLEQGLEQVRQPAPPDAAALGAVALYGRAPAAPRSAAARPPGEPSSEEIEALVTGVRSAVFEEPVDVRDEEPTGFVLLALGPRTQLLVSPSLVPRLAALRSGGPSLADGPLVAAFERLPAGQLVVAATFPAGLRGTLGRMLRAVDLEQDVPAPTAAGLSLALRRARMDLRARLETADEVQAERLVGALEALRRGTRATAAGLASRPSSPSGLGSLVRLLDELRLDVDGRDVTADVVVDDALASLAMLGVVGAQVWLGYLGEAQAASDELRRTRAQHAAELAEAQGEPVLPWTP
ncbi:MAG: hypothetical protein JXB32_13835 [Deltaproteobacteria bacterium]|nr:hypothetical protein [Deltaproteobacteria bacterium]